MAEKRPRDGDDAAANANPDRAKVRKVGGLKLKGKALPVMGKAGVVKKEKPKDKAAESRSGAASAAATEAPAGGERRITDAELKFQALQRKRLEKHAEETAQLSFRERIEQQNARYSKLTEHNDIPKVTYRTNK